MVMANATETATQITMANAIKIVMPTEMESVITIVTQTVINVKETAIQMETGNVN